MPGEVNRGEIVAEKHGPDDYSFYKEGVELNQGAVVDEKDEQPNQDGKEDAPEDKDDEKDEK